MKRSFLHVSGIVVLLILLASCSGGPKPTPLAAAKGAFDELRSAVRKEIKDPDRAARSAGLVNELEELIIEANKGRNAHEDRIRSLNANYDATEEDFCAAFREFNAIRSDRQQRILEINERAKALTTAEEWKTLAKAQDDMIRKALDAAQMM